MAEVIIAVADHFDFGGPTGVAFPGVVLDGVVHTAANLHRDWIGVDLADLVGSRLRGPSVFLTDADAAGPAEAHFGAAKGTDGVVVIVALGTGIGLAMINDGRLVANSELGHLELRGNDAETYAAASARQRNGQPGRSGAPTPTTTSSTSRVWSGPRCSCSAAASPKTRRRGCSTYIPRTPICPRS